MLLFSSSYGGKTCDIRILICDKCDIEMYLQVREE